MSNERSFNLNLPYIAPSQAQKHITHNEAIRLLDRIVNLSVESDGLSTPPPNPTDNSAYIIASNSGGEWVEKSHKIALFQEGGWQFLTPQTGWMCYVKDTALLKVWTGDIWKSLSDVIDLDGYNFTQLGINTTADSENTLALAASNSLFSHNGQSHRLKINKQAETDTASVLFQMDYTGKAELGLNGNNDLSFKVSEDGFNFKESLRAESDTGLVSFPQGIRDYQTGRAIASYIPSEVKEIWRLDIGRISTPRTYTIGSVSGQTLTLSEPVAGTIFSPGMQGNARLRLWNMSKNPPEPCWVEGYISETQLAIHNSHDLMGWLSNDVLQIGDPAGEPASGENLLGMVALDISPYLENSLGTVFKQKAVSVVTRSEALDGAARLGLSETGKYGSAVDGYSLSDGQANNVSFTIRCSVPSPISNSHLLYIRETLEPMTTSHKINFVRIVGVWS